jgi:hypothetical protein
MIRFQLPLPENVSARIVTEQINALRTSTADAMQTERKSYTRSERFWIWNKDFGICHLCGRPVAFVECEISHDIPLKAGGRDVDSNRHPAHRSCHAKRTQERDRPMMDKARRVRRYAAEGRGTKRKGRAMQTKPAVPSTPVSVANGIPAIVRRYGGAL